MDFASLARARPFGFETSDFAGLVGLTLDRMVHPASIARSPRLSIRQRRKRFHQGSTPHNPRSNTQTGQLLSRPWRPCRVPSCNPTNVNCQASRPQRWAPGRSSIQQSLSPRVYQVADPAAIEFVRTAVLGLLMQSGCAVAPGPGQAPGRSSRLYYRQILRCRLIMQAKRRSPFATQRRTRMSPCSGLTLDQAFGPLRFCFLPT